MPPPIRRRQLRSFRSRTHLQGAEAQLRRFRKGTQLAVAVTAMLLLLWGPLEVEGQPDPAGEPAAPAELSDPSVALSESTKTVRDLAYSFYGFAPRIVLVLVIFGVAALVARGARALIERVPDQWERRSAAIAITRVSIWLVAAIAAVSIVAGDARAAAGSLGLLGLAASWALQTPIESFTGWLLNSFRGYYRVGDRIAVGDVFGDVYRIDVLTTTIWEAGGKGKPVSAAQSTGALITVPNWEVLRSNIVNYSRDFPHVWDEVTFSVANESDLAYSMNVIQDVARRVLGPQMTEAAQEYEALLRRERLSFGVEEVPRVYLSAASSWTDCTLRYLVPVRTRRHWSSTLILEVSRELAKPEHAGRIIPVYPRMEVKVQERWPPADQRGG